MHIQLLSTDFDGTIVSRVSEPVLDRRCMELIREMQDAGAIWAINTGRSVDLLESGLADFSFPIRPDFILTTERDVFRPGQNGGNWEPLAIGTTDARAIMPTCFLLLVRSWLNSWISPPTKRKRV